MAALIISRDLFVTGLRMLFLSRGVSLITSKLAKFKTATQISAIVFVLSYMALKAVTLINAEVILSVIESFNLIYYAVYGVTLFTVYTGINYLYVNRAAIQEFVTTSHDLS